MWLWLSEEKIKEEIKNEQGKKKIIVKAAKWYAILLAIEVISSSAVVALAAHKRGERAGTNIRAYWKAYWRYYISVGKAAFSPDVSDTIARNTRAVEFSREVMKAADAFLGPQYFSSTQTREVNEEEVPDEIKDECDENPDDNEDDDDGWIPDSKVDRFQFPYK